MFFLCFGVIFPFFSGLLFYAPLMCAWEWFGKLKGMCSGIILAGFGLGTFFFGPLAAAIVNPHDEKREIDPVSGEMYFSRDVSERVPVMLMTCTIIWSFFALIGLFTIQRNPDYVQDEAVRLRKAQILQD